MKHIMLTIALHMPQKWTLDGVEHMSLELRFAWFFPRSTGQQKLDAKMSSKNTLGLVDETSVAKPLRLY